MGAARGWRMLQGKHKRDKVEDVITQLSKLGQLEEEKKDRAPEQQGQWRKRTQEDREKILLVLLADDTSMSSTFQMGTRTFLNYRFLLKQVCTRVPQDTLAMMPMPKPLSAIHFNSSGIYLCFPFLSMNNSSNLYLLQVLTLPEIRKQLLMRPRTILCKNAYSFYHANRRATSQSDRMNK